VNELLEAAVEIQQVAGRYHWQFCFIGGLALQRWGEPRFTRDVDLTLLTGFGGEAPYVDRLLSHFSPRRTDARDFALRYRVLLLLSASGVGLDVALGALPFEAAAIKRASVFTFAPGYDLLTCSAEDLVIMKSFAARPQDWIDVEGIVIRQGAALAVDYVLEQLAPLCEAKDDPAIFPRLRSLLAKHQAG
jgi:Nucleotidyl transferase AbiEii toxin, Type IV TA system